jgi:hypothetical protein
LVILFGGEMIECRQAGKLDIENFRYDGIEYSMLQTIDINKQLELYAKIGHVWVTVKDNEPIAIYGLYECSPKVLHCWMLFNKASAKAAKTIIKEMKQILEESMNTHHRIQTYLFMGDHAAKYLKVLNFKKEGTMRAFGPQKEDAEIWAMVSE